jgi:pilus assembly protein CpaE
VGHVGVVRKIESYPTPVELFRILRAHAPDLIFVNTDVLSLALDLVGQIEKNFQGLQVVAFNRKCEQHSLLEVMRAGVREYLTYPFDHQVVGEAVARLADIAQRRSPIFQSTDLLYAFLPSKPGVGASTLALNASISLSRVPDCDSLLMDLDLSSGVVRFLLKLENGYSIMDASENANRMDETLWPQMITKFEKLDVLHAGPLNPDVRIEPVQVRNLLEFARRHYRVICADLSGNLERYSFEVMNEAKRIFLVCTAEMSSLHLAREKFQYLRSKDLGDRVAVLMNRCQKRSQFGVDEIEDMLGVPVFGTFTNDYTGVQKAISNAKGLEASSELGKQMTALANSMLERRSEPLEARGRRFIEYFSIVPGRTSTESRRTAS